MKKIFLALIAISTVASFSLSAQDSEAESLSEDILTATNLFNQVAEQYGYIQDYSAEFRMVVEDDEMTGILYYLRPSLLRIDFSEPEEQVLVSNGETLQIYIPRYNVTLSQQLSSTTPGSIATAEGLVLLKQNYSIAFKESPAKTPLDDPEVENGSDEAVQKLLLTWRNTREGFRTIELAISDNKFIRRITGLTTDNKEVLFDFTDIRINQAIPESRFDYDSPPSSNNYDDFLFGQD